MNRIKELRKANGYSQQKLAQILNVHQTAISQWETERTNPDIDIASQLSDLFDVSLEYLLGKSDIKNKPSRQNQNDSPLNTLPVNVFPIKTKRIPLLGEIACGEPIYTNEEHGEYVMTSDEVDADLCLRAKGDSMTGARIFDGDIVFIRKQDAVDNGEIAAVIIGDEATLKRVYYFPSENKLVLSAENPAYAPLMYVGDELDSVRILGRAIAFQSLVR